MVIQRETGVISLKTLQALSAGVGIQLYMPIEQTRFESKDLEPPYLAPPYSSILDDAMALNEWHKAKNELRQTALRPIKLHAGQTNFPNGEFGRPAAKDPVNLPELLGGKILTTNV